MPQRIIVRHPKTGHEVGIEAGDFRTKKLVKDRHGNDVTYEEAGYRVVSNMDGSEYRPPAPRPKAEG